MKQKLLEILVCPLCRSTLDLHNARQSNEIIESAVLYCTNCGHPYNVTDGIPDMLSPALPRIDEKLREARGWVELSKKEGWYTPTPEIDLALPDVVAKLGWDPADASGWLATKHSFELMMEDYVQPGMRVLEVGAARAWAGRYFANRGCEYVACDIVADPNIGLGRSRFFIEHSSHYEAVLADGEQLPFRTGAFDLVFAIAALHHALDLPLMVAEMARVTKVGGVVAGLNEGVRSFSASPDAELQATEKTYGINEHVHTLWGYFSAFGQNKLFVTRMERAIGYQWFMASEQQTKLQRLRSIPGLGEWLAAIYVLGFQHPYDGVTIFSRKWAA